MENQISPEDIEKIKQAKDQQKKLESAGIHHSGEQVKSVPSVPQPEEKKEYENFIEINNIPSNGIFYPNPLKGQALKVQDLLLLQGITERNIYGRFNEILSRRLRGIEPSELLLADEEFIALWLRESTYPGYGFPYDEWECSTCRIKHPENDNAFGFENLSFTSNLEEITAAYKNKGYVEFTLPKSNRTCKIILKQRKHDGRARAILHRDYYQYDRTPPDGTEDLMQILSVVNIGIDDLVEAVNEVKNMEAIDFVELLKNVKKYTLNSEITVNLTCDNEDCKGVTSMSGYPFREEIYLPINS